MKKNELLIKISGRVQGVNFRRRVAKIADQFRLSGYVKNLTDGSVEVLAQGKEEALEELLTWCQKGYFPAKVTGMSFEWREMEKEHKKFKIEKAKKNFILDEAHSILHLGRDLLDFSEKEINSPNHVVIIPDGNRRWARERGYKPWVGHKKAATLENIEATINECQKLGIEYLSFWALSTENWIKREGAEVEAIFMIARKLAKGLKKMLIKNKIKAKHIGRRDRLPKDIIEILLDIEESTKQFEGMNFIIAMDYGGQDEIVRAMSKMFAAKETEINDETIRKYLDTYGLPDPDLIIRTAGERRTSGFMPYQAAYAELYFTNVYFPDFDTTQFRRAILDYSGRTRRFGGTDQNDLKNINESDLKDTSGLNLKLN
ncbi:MAG: polyprenyl diphosphate synthase [Candidatus Dojkabacteria bacterium]|nr:polyprenyl diphosphate synthase [Candidatus Dojkabacteria bacterium]